ncbi:MAG: hypothetical protein C0504_08430 [Candidatus Solibacter sp.]|nr:hypothetical protein [Candidatus Solibacter sp.]
MQKQAAALAVLSVMAVAGMAWAQPAAKPAAGPVAIMKSAEIKPGMKGTAWTVFEGTEPEAIPVEIIGLWKNAWGPKQDVILAKLGGKAARTNVAGGMSGSPVYVDGKLIGAVALRISVFSPDAICGITPIEHMLEINEIDSTTPPSPKTPQHASARAELAVPENLTGSGPRMVAIETPLTFSGFHQQSLEAFSSIFRQMGIQAVMGGAAGNSTGSAPAPGWQKALAPGDAIAGVLVSGDLNITGLGTVTYNDGRRVLGFGHSFFNLGPVSMPMAKGEVLMVLSSQLQPNKFANATEIAGALRQDRHSGIMGILGEQAETIPVTLEIDTPKLKETLNFNIFVHPKWTPFLMTLTVFNSLQGLNDAAADEATYMLEGDVELTGLSPLKVKQMAVTGDGPMPAPMAMAVWWGDRFNRLFQNPESAPRIKRVTAKLKMAGERKLSIIEGAWLDSSDVEPGGTLTGKVALRRWRGERVVREFKIPVPATLAAGDHRLLVSDGDTLNRTQAMAAMVNRNSLELAEVVSIMNQEKGNDNVYVSFLQSRPTVYAGDRQLGGLPPSVINAMQAGRTARPVTAAAETVNVGTLLKSDEIVSGNLALRFKVK